MKKSYYLRKFFLFFLINSFFILLIIINIGYILKISYVFSLSRTRLIIFFYCLGLSFFMSLFILINDILLKKIPVKSTLWVSPLLFTLVINLIFILCFYLVPEFFAKKSFWSKVTSLPDIKVQSFVYLLYTGLLIVILFFFVYILVAFLTQKDRYSDAFTKFKWKKRMYVILLGLIVLIVSLLFIWVRFLPDNVVYHFGIFSYSVLHDFASAIRYFSYLIEKWPDSKLKENAVFRLAIIYRRNFGNFDLAIKNYKRFIYEFKNSRFKDEALIELADMYIEMKQYSKALRVLSQFLKEFSDNSLTDEALLYMAICYYKTNRLQKVKECIVRLYNLNNIQNRFVFIYNKKGDIIGTDFTANIAKNIKTILKMKEKGETK